MRFFENRPLSAALALFMAVFAGSLFAGFAAKIAVLSLSAAVAGIILIVKRRVTLVCGLTLACAAACALSLYHIGVTVSGAEKEIGRAGVIRAEVRSVTYRAAYTTYADVDVIEIDGEKADFRAKLNCGYYLEAGERDLIEFEGEVTELSENSGGFNEKKYYRSKSIYVAVESDAGYAAVVGRAGFSLRYFFSDIGDFCAERLSTLLQGDALGLANAVLLGDRSGLSRPFTRDFRTLGLSHMLAVSGLHLSVLIGGIHLLLKRLKIKKAVRCGVVIILCLFYMGITGGAPSIVRSGIMFIILCISDLAFRYNDPVTSLFAAGSGMIFFNPSTVYDVGFLLSFFATLGILCVSPGIQSLGERAKSKGRAIDILYKRIASPALVTCSAVAFTLPVTAMNFGKISVLTPLTNIIFSPLISVVLFTSPLTVALSYVSFAGAGAAFVVKTAAGGAAGLSSFFARLGAGELSLGYPFVKYLIGALVVCILILFFVRLKNGLAFILPFAGFLALYLIFRAVFLSGFDSYYYLSFINDGKNDAVCVYDGDRTTLIDVSNGKRAFINKAADLLEESFYHDRIDRLVITHYHSKTVNSFRRICDERYIDNVLLPAPQNEKESDYLLSIAAVCDEKGIRYFVSDDTASPEEYGDILLSHGYIGRSTHPVICFILDIPEGSMLYAGSSFSDVYTAGRADIVFFGSHGPVSRGWTVFPECQAAVYADDKAEKAPGSELEYLIPDGKPLILRIKK